ncbi:MAG: DNA-directed RNA polymerase subunit beta [Parcubacteria group bacterium RIFCSPLOWO2_01_FULL_48_18]|nr:MAG: DNA-directed RNA polymerase subunit beta [Parcubacteria group bacterium RIFCSPLOWO2_01_FULL_48_18]
MQQKLVKVFSTHPGNLVPLPNLVEIQTRSYDLFLRRGLRELMNEISPIKDYTGKELELYFDDYYFDDPKYDEFKSREKDLTHEASLRVKARLVHKKTGEAKKQEVYMGDFPVMTPRGTFIINGVERVVVSQLIRSSGVYFTANMTRGRKLFGAKVIPNRGAWLEFETDPDGVIGVKIDRKRKIPVTSLVRIFGLTDNHAILDAIGKEIEPTLKKEPSKTLAEAFIEIYKRIRPGDLATAENSKSLIEGMFKRADRYDLSEVGRFKLNQRLNLKGDSRLLTCDDIVAIIRHIIVLNNDSDAEPDDIDHLGNRRVRAVGELLQNKLRVGFARMRRIIQDRMSTIEVNLVTPAQLINSRPVVAATKEFFSASQLSQFMDQVNLLAELEHKRRISAMGPGGLTRERAGFEVRDVHSSHYGRICPIQTPEGANIGLVGHLAIFSRINELGFLESPYVRVKNGRVTGEVAYLNAYEEEKYRIAHGGVKFRKDGKLIDEIIEARIKGEPGTCRRDQIDFIDVAPYQLISVATSLIPFLEHDDANRALMGSNMQRQAVAYIKPSAPLVGTGMEEKAAAESGLVALADEPGTVTEADANHIKVKTAKGYRNYRLHTFTRSNQFTCISQQPRVEKNQRVEKGTVLADGPSTEYGVLSLGQNLVAAFMSWAGANFEDAIILSERVVREDLYTSIHIEDYYCDVRDTKLGPEVTTYDIPNVSEEKLKNLDEEGIIRVGAEVESGDILVGKITPKGEAELTAEERLLRVIFGEKSRDVKDTSLTLPHGKRGRVVGIRIFSRDRGDKLEAGIIMRVQVEVAQLRNIRAGDKLAGRHGNKGVVSRIVSVEDMPYLEDGTPVDIILNPLGVASRMNIGQILEMHLGWAAHTLGYRAITPALAGANEDQIKGELKRAGLPENGKVTLYDGRNGRPFDQKIAVGYIYMMKLNHLVEDKIHMRSVGPYSLITQQPLGGKAQFGGQRFGEMEVWALEGYGAAHILQEMLTIKSDDVVGRAAAYESMIRGEPIRSPNIPASFNVLVSELKSLGMSVNLLKGGSIQVPAVSELEEEKIEPVSQEVAEELAKKGKDVTGVVEDAHEEVAEE